MVTGKTRQVVIIKGTPDTSFEQAIFFVRQDIISKGGISENALLKQARHACRRPPRTNFHSNLLWASFGGCFIGALWLLITIVI